MRWIAPRLGLRALIGGVALVALGLGFWRRSTRLHQQAEAHVEKAAEYASDSFHLLHDQSPISEANKAWADRCMVLYDSHPAMATRIERTLWRPWLAFRSVPPAPASPGESSTP